MKVAVSIPDAVFTAGEKLAAERGVSRSRLYSDALAEYLDAHGNAAVTARLDAVYATQRSTLDPAMRRVAIESLEDEAW